MSSLIPQTVLALRGSYLCCYVTTPGRRFRRPFSARGCPWLPWVPMGSYGFLSNYPWATLPPAVLSPWLPVVALGSYGFLWVPKAQALRVRLSGSQAQALRLRLSGSGSQGLRLRLSGSQAQALKLRISGSGSQAQALRLRLSEFQE